MTDMTLDNVEPGKYTVDHIDTISSKYMRRMIHLGIYSGTEIIKCVESKKSGPVILLVKGSTLIIGNRIASRIHVVMS